MLDIAANAILVEQAAGVVHAVEGFVQHEAQLRRVFQRHGLGDQMAQLGLIAAKRDERLFGIMPAQRQDKGRRDLEVGRRADLAHRDRVAVQVGVMDVRAQQDIGKGAADQLAHAQLALRRAGP